MFLDRTDKIGGGQRRVQYVQCQHPGCTNCFESVVTQIRKPDVALCRIASQKGWWIHFKKRRAFCPQHVRH